MRLPRSLPVTRDVEIKTPCTESWEAMPGDARARRCDRCETTVRDVAQMSALELRAWLLLSNNAFCGRLTLRDDGAVLLRAEPAEHGHVRSSRRPAMAALGVALALGTATTAQANECTAAGAQIPAAPPADRDGDGVPDAVDACPDAPGAPDRSTPGNSGCPPRTTVLVGGVGPSSITIHEQIRFARRSAALPSASLPLLDELARVLAQNPSIARVAVEGHVDPSELRRGPDLALQRAQAVLEWLVAHGVDRARLEAQSHGAQHPLAEGHRARDQAQNRRVQFAVLATLP